VTNENGEVVAQYDVLTMVAKECRRRWLEAAIEIMELRIEFIIVARKDRDSVSYVWV
jgi:hypothetical protein